MAHTRHRAHPCPDPSTGLRLAQLSLLQLHVPPPRSNVSSSIRNRPRNATDRRDEEAKAHEAARGQSPPLRGSCSWKTPPLTASFLTSQRSQTGALPAPAFLLESLPSARQPRDANDRGDEAKPGRTHESCRHKTEKGPKAPPAGRPAIRWDGTGRRLPRAAGLCLHSGAPRGTPRCKSATEQQESKPGAEAGTKQRTRTNHGLGRARGAGPRRSAQPPLPQRKRSAQGGIAPFAGGQHRSVAFFLTAAFRSGHCRISARRGPGPTAAPRRPAPPRPATTPPPRRHPIRAARPAACPGPPAEPSQRDPRGAQGRKDGRTAARPALTARLHCGAPRGPSARGDRRTRIQGAQTAARGRAPSARLREGARGRGRGRGRPSRAQAATPPHAHILSATPSGRAHSFLNTAGRVIGREDDGRWGRPRPAGRDRTTRMPIPSGAGGG